MDSQLLCFINRNRYNVDMKAAETDVADADKEKQKRNESCILFIMGWNANYKLQEFLKENSE